MNSEGTWWQDAVVYQIYPQSFNDSDGDGVGDLSGIHERLDYLDELGVDIIWLNPVYDSPHHDDGYDVRDYRSIREEYGTMADWEQLLAALHERDMRLIMDLVVNHTSDEHEWFQASRRAPDGEYGDYYVWRDGRPATDATDSPGPPDRAPPNDWEAAFGGPAWSYDDLRGQYYLHLFLEEQPDLDWTTPDVRTDVYEMMEWWLEKGIDGFRLDVINLVSKPADLSSGRGPGIEACAGGPRLEEFLAEMAAETFDNYDAVTIGEMPAVTVEQARRYTGPDGPLDMVFHFDHMTLDYDEEDGWWGLTEPSLADLKEVITRWQTELADGWNALYLGNHDQPRIVSRFGDDEQYRYESATALATLLLTLRGTPFIYQGDELSIRNYPFESLAEQEDAMTVGRVQAAIDRGEIDSFETVRELVRERTRDNARTPMQWDATANAGFTDGDPWLPVNPDYREVNAAAQQDDPRSVLAYYQRLIELRHETPALVYGEYELLLPAHESVFAYRRTLEDDRLLVVLNLDDEPSRLETLAASPRLLGNYDDPTDTTTLRPYEAVIAQDP
ncbi:alpha-glucosidase [Halosegnis sp.]|uniref:glycoside hydrolase family 13 protein n=1 Tax=Halosegnis sp. TaxID=2864959 RepID=UPI0035D46170